MCIENEHEVKQPYGTKFENKELGRMYSRKRMKQLEQNEKSIVHWFRQLYACVRCMRYSNQCYRHYIFFVSSTNRLHDALSCFLFLSMVFFGYRSFAMHFGDGMLSAARIQLKALFPPSIEFRREMFKRSRLQTIRAEHDISLMWERCICDRETENNEHEIIVSV